MEDTGERHILNGHFNNKSELYLHLLHIATYEYAEKFVKNKTVLDFGCGSGYGTEMLSKNAAKVTGADISKEAVDYAKNNYNSDNLDFKTISELTDQKFDVITSFQVIEHVPNDIEYVTKLKKLLNPGGYLLISTPDKTHRLFNHIQKPWNIFHLKEYTPKSLENLLKKHFSKVEILKIGSESDLVLTEISRTKKQKIITLPSTLSLYPNALRVFLLNFQKKLFDLVKKYRPSNNESTSDGKTDHNFASGYSSKDIIIKKETDLSTDLFAVCIND
jgi:2-polyprenyl-3-methyl-5-hydroxy-6-metoxy-1,4-benzoquinol methylase